MRQTMSLGPTVSEVSAPAKAEALDSPVLVQGFPQILVDVDSNAPLKDDPRGRGWVNIFSYKKNPFGRLNITLVPLLRNGEVYVRGDLLAAKTKILQARLGHRHAEAILARRDEIPKAWQLEVPIPFTGDLWKDTKNITRVSCLVWCARTGWELDYAMFDNSWCKKTMVPVACPAIAVQGATTSVSAVS